MKVLRLDPDFDIRSGYYPFGGKADDMTANLLEEMTYQSLYRLLLGEALIGKGDLVGNWSPKSLLVELHFGLGYKAAV